MIVEVLSHTYLHTNSSVVRSRPRLDLPKDESTYVLNLAHLKKTSIAPTHAHFLPPLQLSTNTPYFHHRIRISTKFKFRTIQHAHLFEQVCNTCRRPVTNQRAAHLRSSIKRRRGLWGGGGTVPVRTCETRRQVKVWCGWLLRYQWEVLAFCTCQVGPTGIGWK